MFKNTGIVKVFLFLACLYLVDIAKKAGYINVGIQVAIIVVLMVLFLFGKQLIQKLKK